MKAYALTAIQRGKSANPRNVEPGTVFDVSGAEEKRLVDNLAIREATKDEIALAKENGKLIEGSATKKSSSDDEKAAAEKAAAEKAAAEKAAAEKAAAEKAAAEKAGSKPKGDNKGGDLDL